MALLLQAGKEKATTLDRAVLARLGVKRAVLDGLPGWLVKYAALVAAAVQEQCARLGTREAREAEEQRLLLTLVLALDCVRHYLGTQARCPAPLAQLTEAQALAAINTYAQFKIQTIPTVSQQPTRHRCRSLKASGLEPAMTLKEGQERLGIQTVYRHKDCYQAHKSPYVEVGTGAGSGAGVIRQRTYSAHYVVAQLVNWQHAGVDVEARYTVQKKTFAIPTTRAYGLRPPAAPPAGPH